MRFRGRPIEKDQLYVGVVALVLVVVYAIVFVLENRSQVTIHFVVFTASVSLIWLILLSLGLGAAGGVLLSQLYRRRRASRS